MVNTKIWLKMLIIVLAFGMTVIGCDTRTGQTIHLHNEDISLVCLGNSLTAGYGATTPGKDDKTKSYPAFLQNRINIPVINAGVSGDTSSEGLSRINKDVLSKNPQIVIIELGANDLFQGIPVAATKDNLQQIIDMVNNGSRKIYLAKFYTETVATGLDVPTALKDQYDNMFTMLASSNNVVLIEDIWNGVWKIHMSDEVHPNATGYEIMANNIFSVLKPYLEANNLVK